MFSLNGCSVTLPNGEKLSRQRVTLDENLLFTSFDRRTGSMRYQQVAESFVEKGKKRYEVWTDEGVILVTKSGCNCGR
jgi:hypothetical protein